jgi:hypothetical protein
MDTLNLQISTTEFERAKEQWLRLSDAKHGRDARECIRRPASPPSFSFRVIHQVDSRHFDCRLDFELSEQEFQLWVQYCTTKNRSSIESASVPLAEVPTDPSQILALLLRDQRRAKALVRYEDWIWKEYQNFIGLFTVPDRDTTHDPLGY